MIAHRFCFFILSIHSIISCVISEVNIINRLEWSAKEPANALTELELPVGRIIIAHTAGNICNTKVNYYVRSIDAII